MSDKRIDLGMASLRDDKDVQLYLTIAGKSETYSISRSAAASFVERIVRVLAKSA